MLLRILASSFQLFSGGITLHKLSVGFIESYICHGKSRFCGFFPKFNQLFLRLSGRFGNAGFKIHIIGYLLNSGSGLLYFSI